MTGHMTCCVGVSEPEVPELPKEPQVLELVSPPTLEKAHAQGLLVRHTNTAAAGGNQSTVRWWVAQTPQQPLADILGDVCMSGLLVRHTTQWQAMDRGNQSTVSQPLADVHGDVHVFSLGNLSVQCWVVQSPGSHLPTWTVMCEQPSSLTHKHNGGGQSHRTRQPVSSASGDKVS